LDTQVYGALHTRTDSSAALENPGDFRIDGVDEALDTARRSLDENERDAAYRQVQADYVEDPTYVMRAFLDPAYVAASSGWDTGPLVIEPHSHGIQWGPWWDLADWES